MSRQTLTIVSSHGAYFGLGTCASYYPYVLKTKSIDNREIQFACLPFYWVLDDFPYFTWGGVRAHGGASGIPGGNYLAMGSPREALDYWLKEFQDIHEMGGLFNHVCHPRIIGRASRMRIMDQLIAHMKKTPGVWFATMREIADWVLKTGEVRNIPNYGG